MIIIKRLRVFYRVCAAASLAAANAMAEDASKLWEEGEVIFDARYRLETVDQDGFAEEAMANTLRARVGFVTGEVKGFSFLAEGEFVTHVGEEDYNSIANGNTQFPVIPDPDAEELNRLQLSYKPSEKLSFVIGRQRINRGNQRFVGAVGFRQNEQTYDAVRFDVKPADKVDATYIYANQVNRIFGAGNPNETFEGDIHLLDGTMKLSEGVKASAYYYFLDLENAAALSTATFGGRLDAVHPLSDDVKLKGFAELATQSDAGDNPNSIDLLYTAVEGGAQKGRVFGAVGYESLEGDGTVGFSTPLATLHKFNGFADAFLATPANGLTDLYVKGGVGFGDVGKAKNVKFTAWYHKFDEESGDADLGQEVDVILSAAFGKYVSTELRYAHFDGEDGPAGRKKLWFAVGFKR